MNYYNEFDQHAAAWLRELIAAKLIPQGVVDERSIAEVQASDLAGYTQCHFFAGIAGWPLALDLAGWDRSRPVWTGSCPCQPYSQAGKQLGDADPRNLWPHFFRLIRECRPECVFGEQVSSAIGKGWLDGISADLEGEGYAVGACVLGAHSVGAPHQRQRLYWVSPLQHAASDGRQQGRAESDRGSVASGCGASGGLLHAIGTRLEGYAGDERNWYEPGRIDPATERSTAPAACRRSWDDYDLIHFRDGKTRRIEPGTFPLAHGVPGRVAQLRGLGNAIVPQVAAAFVEAFIETQAEGGE